MTASLDLAGFGPWQWLEIVEHELLLFAAVFFALGGIDEFLVDLAWLRLRLTGKARAERFSRGPEAVLTGPAAVLVPAWREAEVVAAMLRHALTSWPERELRIYAGCYRNDAETLAALVDGAQADPRVRVVVHRVDGPTTKADCLNRLYAALIADERRGAPRARSVILHDAEDMVHPEALALIDRALDHADFVQLPVLPVPQAASPWIAGHYGDEFAEAHGKNLVVRDRLGVGIPAAGVGCGFARAALERVASARGRGGDEGPFAAECLTEDYELGLMIAANGGVSRFLRRRDFAGELIATREFFPAELGASVRQKTRWLHGIAFQGWDRLGWAAPGQFGRPAELWMRLRDRRGPLTAIVLAVAYLVIFIWGALFVAERMGWHEPQPLAAGLGALLWFNFASFVWRAGVRFAFSARTYGAGEGVRALLRIPIANIVAIMAGRRAILAYGRSLFGGRVRWEKTVHHYHPATLGGEARTSG